MRKLHIPARKPLLILQIVAVVMTIHGERLGWPLIGPTPCIGGNSCVHGLCKWYYRRSRVAGLGHVNSPSSLSISHPSCNDCAYNTTFDKFLLFTKSDMNSTNSISTYVSSSIDTYRKFANLLAASRASNLLCAPLPAPPLIVPPKGPVSLPSGPYAPLAF